MARHHQRERNASSAEPRLCDFSDAVLRRSVVVVLDCDMAITNDPNEVMLANTPPRNGDGVGFLPKVRRCCEWVSCRRVHVCASQHAPFLV